MKKTVTNARGSAGFTLVELLVVIGIIAILAAILLPAMSGAFSKADKAMVRAQVNAIKTAIQAYVNDYGKLPIKTGHGDNDNTAGNQSVVPSADVISILTAADTTYNPRKIVYLDLSEPITNGVLYDVWGKEYEIRLDKNYNGSIGNPPVNTIAIVTSGGPDKTLSATADNIVSGQ